jgi:hypothetical protein
MKVWIRKIGRTERKVHKKEAGIIGAGFEPALLLLTFV